MTRGSGLCLSTKLGGGNASSGKNKPRANRAAQALRLAPAALRTSQWALGAYCRRVCARTDKPKAVTAAAHKLARLIYSMPNQRRGMHRLRSALQRRTLSAAVLHNLNRRAQRLGLTLVPTAPAAQAAQKSLENQSLGRSFLGDPICSSEDPPLQSGHCIKLFFERHESSDR